MLKQGSSFGNYSIDYLAGSGTYGAAYVVRDVMTSNRVVLKIQKEGEEPTILYEALRLKSLGHVMGQSIPKVLSFGAKDDRQFLCME